MATSGSHRRWPVPVLVAVAIATGAVLSAGTISLSKALGADEVAALPAPQALSNTFASIVEKASPAVVFIQVEKTVRGMPAGLGPDFFDGPFGEFFGRGFGGRGMPPAGIAMGQGSGFIVSPDGYIITNNHVVGDMDKVQVTLADGRRFEAKLIGTDPQTEVALIKIDAKDLPCLPIGDSDALRVGDWVLAIGSPFGLSHSVTSGIVSARGRGNVGIVDYADFIQTDAAINPGNSGGPLLNMRGEVVGMNTAILSPSGGNNGIGFAIPMNMVQKIADQLREKGSVTRGYLGIGIQDLTPELAKWFNLDVGQGVLVAQVAPDSPAERAGLKRDDVIVEMNGRPVGESGAFRSHVATTTPGSKIDVGLIRNGQRINKTIEVGKLENTMVAGREQRDEATEEVAQGKLGVGVQPLTPEIAAELGYEGDKGVVVAQVVPGSPAARAGLRPGVLIKEVNRQEVENVRDLRNALKNGGKDNSALLLVREGEGTRYVAIDVT